MMSATQVDELVETATPDDDTRPPIAHVYCGMCARGRVIATSVCGHGRKPTAELRIRPWLAGEQACTVCADLENTGCPRCGR